MLRKHLHYNRYRGDAAASSAQALEREGHVLLTGVFDPHEVASIREDVDRVFREYPSDGRGGAPDPPRSEMFRYEMFNRSSLVQAAIENPRILEAVEPLLGVDCHIIANTSWRNPADRSSAPDGQPWHVDGGPHVVRPPGVPWPEEIPYPVSVVTAQVYLRDVRLASAPRTDVEPRPHVRGERCGRAHRVGRGRDAVRIGHLAPSYAPGRGHPREGLRAVHLCPPRDRTSGAPERALQRRWPGGAGAGAQPAAATAHRAARALLLRRLMEAVSGR